MCALIRESDLLQVFADLQEANEQARPAGLTTPTHDSLPDYYDSGQDASGKQQQKTTMESTNHSATHDADSPPSLSSGQ